MFFNVTPGNSIDLGKRIVLSIIEPIISEELIGEQEELGIGVVGVVLGFVVVVFLFFNILLLGAEHSMLSEVDLLGFHGHGSGGGQPLGDSGMSPAVPRQGRGLCFARFSLAITGRTTVSTQDTVRGIVLFGSVR